MPQISNKLNLESVEAHRPISPCNVIYKIIAKTSVNRLELVLGKLINPLQYAFVSNRHINDNMLVSVEIIQDINCKSKGKRVLSVAYDRISWTSLPSM